MCNYYTILYDIETGVILHWNLHFLPALFQISGCSSCSQNPYSMKEPLSLITDSYAVTYFSHDLKAVIYCDKDTSVLSLIKPVETYISNDYIYFVSTFSVIF